MENLNFINTYFIDEKIESLLFIILGILSIMMALIFLFIIQYSFYKGFAYPLLLIGVIQLIVGTTVYIRSPKDIIRVGNMIKFETKKIKTEELPRIEKVLYNFTIYKWFEIGLIILGIILFFYFKNSALTFWKGFGLGLLIQASVMLTLDVFAENRSRTYFEMLLNWTI